MAVLPENMDRLNADDTRTSISIIDNYIRYMGERIEFAFSNMTKTVSNAGVSSATLYIMVVALTNQLSALQSTVNTVQSTVNTISGQITAINEEIQSLKDRVTALEGTTEPTT